MKSVKVIEPIEKRIIKVSSKRQFTIPKSYFEAMGSPETFRCYLYDWGIALKPIRKDELFEEENKSNEK